MNILHLTHTDVRVDSRILKELGALDDAKKYTLHAIGVAEQGAEGGADARHRAIVVSIRLFSRSIRWLPKALRHVLIYFEMTLRVLVKGISVRPQLIHCHDTPLLPVAVLLAWLFNGKVIYDAHELESKKNGQSVLMSRITYFLEKALWGSVDGFVTVSRSILVWYQSQFAQKDSALVFNSPLIEARTSSSQQSVRRFHELYNIPDECLVFVYLGFFVPGRGIETLLKAFAEPEITSHVVFVGRGALGEMIEKHTRINSRVHMHESVPHDQVVTLVSSADYGLCLVENVSLSYYYSLPNKLFEYAFAGVPILASDFPDMKELIERFDLGTVTASDEASIRLSVLRLQSMERKRINKDLSSLGWEAQAEKLRALYRRVLIVKPQNNVH